MVIHAIFTEINASKFQMYRNKSDVVKNGVVRKLKPTRRSVSGFYPLRNGSMIGFESMLERDFIARTDFSLHVVDIIPQPVSVPFVDSLGRQNSYTPDFLVFYSLKNRLSGQYLKPALIEVKERSEWTTNWRQSMSKWKAAYRYAKEQGYAFQIKDETRIRDSAFENIQFLRRYQRMTFDDSIEEVVLTDVFNRGFTTFDYLVNRHFIGQSKSWGVSLIWSLLAKRKLDCNIALPLNYQTELWVPDYE